MPSWALAPEIRPEFVDGLNCYQAYFTLDDTDPSGLSCEAGNEKPAQIICFIACIMTEYADGLLTNQDVNDCWDLCFGKQNLPQPAPGPVPQPQPQPQPPAPQPPRNPQPGPPVPPLPDGKTAVPAGDALLWEKTLAEYGGSKTLACRALEKIAADPKTPKTLREEALIAMNIGNCK